jgi:hypothetical protein
MCGFLLLLESALDNFQTQKKRPCLNPAGIILNPDLGRVTTYYL